MNVFISPWFCSGTGVETRHEKGREGVSSTVRHGRHPIVIFLITTYKEIIWAGQPYALNVSKSVECWGPLSVFGVNRLWPQTHSPKEKEWLGDGVPIFSCWFPGWLHGGGSFCPRTTTLQRSRTLSMSLVPWDLGFFTFKWEKKNVLRVTLTPRSTFYT